MGVRKKEKICAANNFPRKQSLTKTRKHRALEGPTIPTRILLRMSCSRQTQRLSQVFEEAAIVSAVFIPSEKSKMKTDGLDAIHELIRARHARFEKIARRLEEESGMLSTRQTDGQANHLCGDTFQTKTEADKTEEALILGKHKDTHPHIVNNGLRQANTEVKPSFRGRSHCFGGLLHNERK